ncbi:MAG: serine/threonine-protein kinase, partial [Chloroflexota bacterium]
MPELVPGSMLGQYRILEKIGKGGMATVYKAYQAALDRYVAIKVLPAILVQEEGFLARFTQEARAIARLRHPNILTVFDFGEAQGLAYIVMEYVEGGTLKQRLGQPLDLDTALRVVRQVGAALEHAHSQGVLHRDVKPSNVLVGKGDWLLLSDFGLAKMAEG